MLTSTKRKGRSNISSVCSHSFLQTTALLLLHPSCPQKHEVNKTAGKWHTAVWFWGCIWCALWYSVLQGEQHWLLAELCKNRLVVELFQTWDRKELIWSWSNKQQHLFGREKWTSPHASSVSQLGMVSGKKNPIHPTVYLRFQGSVKISINVLKCHHVGLCIVTISASLHVCWGPSAAVLQNLSEAVGCTPY